MTLRVRLFLIAAVLALLPLLAPPALAAYVAPTTRTTGEIITSAIWNQDVVDNMIAIKAAIDDPELAALSGLTSAADKVPYFTGSGTAATTNLFAFGRTLIGSANAAAGLTNLGVSAFAQSILDDTTASAAMTTLGFSTFFKTLVDDTSENAARATLLAAAATPPPLINNEFSVAQRGASFASVASGTYTLDHWVYTKSGAAVHDVSQSSDVPTQAQAGIQTHASILVDCTTVDSSIAAGDYVALTQPIEGYRWVPLSGLATVLSFWVKATKTGTYCVSLRAGDKGYSFVREYTVSSSATWEYKTVAFGPMGNAVGGTWSSTTGVGGYLTFTLSAGSTYQNGSGGNTGNFIATSNQVNGTDSTSNDFRLALVQLSPDTAQGLSPAAPFEPIPYDIQYEACRRYYATYGGASAVQYIAPGQCVSTTIAFVTMDLSPPMRATPTLSVSAAADWAALTAAGASAAATAVAIEQSGLTQLTARVTVASGLVAGNATILHTNGTTNARLKLDAELTAP